MARLEHIVSTSNEYIFILYIDIFPRISISTIDKLINMYTQCVELYDSTLDPIKAYFMEKIQNTFSLDKTIKNLLESPQGK
jgi:hypothetical protein